MNMLKHLKKLKNQKGMTLVELLAVMVIVGIIAAIAIPAIGGLIENTRKDAYISNATSVQEAARLYVVSNENVIEQNGSYPVVITGKPATTTRTGSTTETKSLYNWTVKAGATSANNGTLISGTETPTTGAPVTGTAAEDFNVYVESLLDPHTKQAFKTVTITINKKAGTGELTYKTSLTGSKYKTPDTAKDARELTRTDITEVPKSN